MNILLLTLLLLAPPTVYTERAELGFVSFTEGAGVGRPWKSYSLYLDEHPDRGGDPRHTNHWTVLLEDKRADVPVLLDGQKIAPADLVRTVRTVRRARVEVDRDSMRYGAVVAVRLHTLPDKFERPTLVRVTAGWCAPCQRLKDSFAKVPAVVAGRYEVVEVDCTADRTAGAKYGAATLPTLVVYRGGRETARYAGHMDADRLTEWLVDHQKEAK